MSNLTTSPSDGNAPELHPDAYDVIVIGGGHAGCEAALAAARMGAGILECDVTFTEDLELVCRHAQNDLHTTTNILATPLAQTCVTPFAPAKGGAKAVAECRTSEITLDEYRTLTPKMDAADWAATSVAAYLGGTAGWRTDLYSPEPASIMTHAE